MTELFRKCERCGGEKKIRTSNRKYPLLGSHGKIVPCPEYEDCPDCKGKGVVPVEIAEDVEALARELNDPQNRGMFGFGNVCASDPCWVEFIAEQAAKIAVFLKAQKPEVSEDAVTLATTLFNCRLSMDTRYNTEDCKREWASQIAAFVKKQKAQREADYQLMLDEHCAGLDREKRLREALGIIAKQEVDWDDDTEIAGRLQESIENAQAALEEKP